MSVNKDYYVIAGYDLTGCNTEKYDDWKWTEEGERYTCNQRKGEIQFFDDPMSGDYLYFGYVLANGDEYEFDTTKINLGEIERQKSYVYYKLNQLVDKGIIDKAYLSNFPKYEVIAFIEYT